MEKKPVEVVVVQAGENLYRLAKEIHEVGLNAYLDRPGPYRRSILQTRLPRHGRPKEKTNDRTE